MGLGPAAARVPIPGPRATSVHIKVEDSSSGEDTDGDGDGGGGVFLAQRIIEYDKPGLDTGQPLCYLHPHHLVFTLARRPGRPANHTSLRRHLSGHQPYTRH